MLRKCPSAEMPSIFGIYAPAISATMSVPNWRATHYHRCRCNGRLRDIRIERWLKPPVLKASSPPSRTGLRIRGYALYKQGMSKLPQITLTFWIMKICATTLGETAGDLLSLTLHVGYAISSLILISVFAVTLAAQLISKNPHPFLFWMVILSTSTAGTTMSDYIDRTLGLGYPLGSAILFTILCGIFALWRRIEGTISIKNIRTRKAEAFFWAAILFSNTLGTAMGDFLADSSGFGFGGSALFIGSLIALTIFLHYTTHISQTFLFWAAFVLTRPFGATIGDLFTKPYEKGGLDFGTIGSSTILGAVLIFFILYSSWNKHKKQSQGNR